MLSKVLAVAKKEFVEVMREPATVLIVLLFFPLSTMLLFGYALKFEVENIGLAVLDKDGSERSRRLVDEIKDEKDFVVFGGIAEEEVRAKIDGGEIEAAVSIPENYGEQLENGEKVVLDIQVDGTEPLALKTLTEKMTEIVAEQNRENASEALSELNIEFETQAIEVEKEILYNPDLRDRDFFVPGVIGIVVATIPMLLSCLAIVKEREMGTIEAIMAAPISRPVFILGKLVPYALIGLIGLGITSALGVFWFKIPFRGDMLLYIGASFVFILSSLGLGLLFSVFVRDSVQAIFLVVTFLVISILLSGFVFPVSGMPEVIQQIMRLFPLTYFMTIVRGILIKGVGFAVLKPDLIALTAISLATSVLSSFGLSKKLD